MAGGESSFPAGGAGSSVVGGSTSAAGGEVVVDSPSSAGEEASAGGGASGAGGGGDGGVSPALIALGADGSRDGVPPAWGGDPFAGGEDSSGVLSWAESPSSLSAVWNRSLSSSSSGSSSSPSLSSLEAVELRLVGGLGRLASALLVSS